MYNDYNDYDASITMQDTIDALEQQNTKLRKKLSTIGLHVLWGNGIDKGNYYKHSNGMQYGVLDESNDSHTHVIFASEKTKRKWEEYKKSFYKDFLHYDSYESVTNKEPIPEIVTTDKEEVII